MKISKVTKEFYQLEDGRVYYFEEPLEKVPTIPQLQKMLDKNKEIIEGIKNAAINQ